MCILLTSDEVQVLMPDVEERGRAEGDDGRAHVGVGDDMDTEDIGDGAPICVRKA
jgi:hypothetical protein